MNSKKLGLTIAHLGPKAAKNPVRSTSALRARGSLLIEWTKTGEASVGLRGGKPRQVGMDLIKGYVPQRKGWKRKNKLWLYTAGKTGFPRGTPETLLFIELADKDFDRLSKALGGRANRDTPAKEFQRLLKTRA